MPLNVFDNIVTLYRQLFPTGRAFRISPNGWKIKLFRAIAKSQQRFHKDATDVLWTIIPDNEFFTADDATRLELRYGMIVNPAATLEDRKAAIIRKMNHPGNILARQSAGYLESQLQLAGFNVFIHENPNGLTPADVLNAAFGFGDMGEYEMGELEMGTIETYDPDLFSTPEMGELEMGELEMGEIEYLNIIANSINESVDASFQIGMNYKCTFFIGGPEIGTFATVPNVRKSEFRQLILRLKPVQTVGYLQIQYT